MQEEGWDLHKLAQLLSTQPARIAGLQGRKGAIQEGFDADLVVWDPYRHANTTTSACFHKHKEGPFRDQELYGHVLMTFVRAAMVYRHEQLLWPTQPCGTAVNAP